MNLPGGLQSPLFTVSKIIVHYYCNSITNTKISNIVKGNDTTCCLLCQIRRLSVVARLAFHFQREHAVSDPCTYRQHQASWYQPYAQPTINNQQSSMYGKTTTYNIYCDWYQHLVHNCAKIDLFSKFIQQIQ